MATGFDVFLKAESFQRTGSYKIRGPLNKFAYLTVGLEIYVDLPNIHTVVVPIGGGGLISGVASALKSLDSTIRVVGVESARAPAMQRSVAEGRPHPARRVDCSVDGLKEPHLELSSGNRPRAVPVSGGVRRTLGLLALALALLVPAGCGGDDSGGGGGGGTNTTQTDDSDYGY